jgi:hypothetical protein
VTFLFQCTPALCGCLYANPGTPDLYFVDNNGIRVLDHTGHLIYDIGDFGFEGRTLIPRAGISTVDFFILNPGRVVENLRQGRTTGNDFRPSFRVMMQIQIHNPQQQLFKRSQPPYATYSVGPYHTTAFTQHPSTYGKWQTLSFVTKKKEKNSTNSPLHKKNGNFSPSYFCCTNVVHYTNPSRQSKCTTISTCY